MTTDQTDQTDPNVPTVAPTYVEGAEITVPKIAQTKAPTNNDGTPRVSGKPIPIGAIEVFDCATVTPTTQALEVCRLVAAYLKRPVQGIIVGFGDILLAPGTEYHSQEWRMGLTSVVGPPRYAAETKEERKAREAHGIVLAAAKTLCKAIAPFATAAQAVCAISDAHQDLSQSEVQTMVDGFYPIA